MAMCQIIWRKKEKKDTESIIRLPATNSVANFSALAEYIYKNVPTSKNRTNSCAKKKKVAWALSSQLDSVSTIPYKEGDVKFQKQV